MSKVVLITGGAVGIGRRLVEDFAKVGYNVFFTYFTNKKCAKELKDKLNAEGYNVNCECMDLSNDNDISKVIKLVMQIYGKIDVLINNASTTNDSLFREKNSKTFTKVLRTNLVGTFEISRLVGDIMYKYGTGKIINISSTNGMGTYFPMCLEYDASKAGLNSLTHNLAMQFAPNVIVNAIAPGFIGTESELQGMDEEFIKMEEDKILLKRMGSTEDVSNLALFLASDKSMYINNQVIKINGGVYGD